MTSYFCGECSDLGEIRQLNAEIHADYCEMVEIGAALAGLITQLGML